MIVVASIVCTIDVIAIGTGLLANPAVLALPITLALFCAAFALQGWTVLLLSASQQRSATSPNPRGRRTLGSFLRGLFGELPISGRIAVAVGFYGAALLAIVTIMSIQGAPSIDSRSGRYQINTHGSITNVSQTRYDVERTKESRILLAISGAFASVALGASANEYRRRRGEQPSLSPFGN